MFASFIDMKIMSTWEEPEPRLAVFDQRVESMKSRLGVVRSPSYEKCNTLKNASKWYNGLLVLRTYNRIYLASNNNFLY